MVFASLPVIVAASVRCQFCFFFALLAVTVATAQPAPQRIAFTLKNNLGYHRMFRVEGPGIAYGFTMNRNERTAKSWPVGAKLYYSNDGEIIYGDPLLTVGEHMAGREVPVYMSLSEQKGTPLAEVRIRLRNNSLWFKKVTLISYRPDETGNGTNGFLLAPYASSQRAYPAGTRLYLADAGQVETVMSGQRLSGKPFLTVSAGDEGKTFPLFR